jgi:thiamine-phosphate pyrophosphorylase
MKDFRLYAITGEQFHPGREMVSVMEEAILGGADVIQLRDKSSDKQELLQKAKALRELTYRHGVTLIVNDHIDIALAADADGVHLGQGDLSLEQARKQMGHNKIIGISTHAIEEARQAQDGGADYIGVGPIFATSTKEDVVAPVSVSYVRQVKEHIQIPFVAIGGIKLGNVDEVLRAGALRICAVSAIVGSSDVIGTCQAFVAKIKRHEQKSAGWR